MSFHYVSEIKTVYKRKRIEFDAVSCPEDIAKIACSVIGESEKEHFLVFLLNSRNEIAGFNVVSIGTMSETLAEPGGVFRAAVIAGARGIIIVHNHPSGLLTPSRPDINLAKRIKQCGEIIDVKLIDSLIVDNLEGSFLSMKETGDID